MIVNLINSFLTLSLSFLDVVLSPLLSSIDTLLVSFDQYEVIACDFLEQGANTVVYLLGTFPLTVAGVIIGIELIFNGVLWVLSIVHAVFEYSPIP